MKRDEAIKILKGKMDGSVDTSYEWAETVHMAIEALEKEEPPLLNIKPGAPQIGDEVIVQGTFSVIKRDGDGTTDVELQNVKTIMKV